MSLPFLYFFSNHREIVMYRLRKYLGISLRLCDVGMTEHLGDILDADAITEHEGGEGVTGEVAV